MACFRGNSIVEFKKITKITSLPPTEANALKATITATDTNKIVSRETIYTNAKESETVYTATQKDETISSYTKKKGKVKHFIQSRMVKSNFIEYNLSTFYTHINIKQYNLTNIK